MVDAFLELLFLSVLMLVSSLSISYFPHLLPLSQTLVKAMNVFGAGLLIGVAILVIIPEGISLIYEANEHVHGDVIANFTAHHLLRSLGDVNEVMV
jgi:hypothetical protein